MTVQDSLNVPLQTELTSAVARCQLINHLCGLAIDPQTFSAYNFELDAYFVYYSEQCRSALLDRGRHVAARTHRDITDIASYIRTGQQREDIKRTITSELLTRRSPDDSRIAENTIDLAASLLLMMQFRDLPFGISRWKPLKWTHGSLQAFLKNQWGSRSMLKEMVKLEAIFNAPNLTRIAGIRIEWTDNLNDHLKMIADDTAVMIFHHASFLEMQRHDLLPAGFIEETLKTLALLFPQNGRETQTWFERIRSDSHSPTLDPKAVRCGRLKSDDRHLEHFTFWRDRLVILKQVFDEAEPNTIPWLWYDRRKGVQWYTFWVAVFVLVLTVFFGFVQSVEGALQVYKAYHPS